MGLFDFILGLKPTTTKQTGISDKGIDFIKSFEALRLKAYLPTLDDVWTIGYGHTKGVKEGQVITEKQALEYLRQDLVWVEGAILRHVLVPLTQGQYDALASFIFNLGETNFKTSTLLRMLNRGEYEEAGKQLLRWDKQNGKVLAGLTRRRKGEKEMWDNV